MTARWRKIGLGAFQLTLLLVLANVLRFYRLTSSSLWSDEGNTWALMERSLSQIARDAAADIHPPGYYWLLKGWTTLVGNDALGLRSFSALLGVVLVYLVFRLGQRLLPLLVASSPLQSTDSTPTGSTALPWLAGLLAALSPFQIYYSQEARMYMLLAVAGAGLFGALLGLMAAEEAGEAGAPSRKWRRQALAYGFWGAIGLWTHYSFPVVLAAAMLAYALWWWSRNRPVSAIVRGSSLRSLFPFGLLNLFSILTFAPWLPTAIERILHWPAGGVQVSFGSGVTQAVGTLLAGPIPVELAQNWPWLVAAGLLPLLGLIRHWRRPGVWALALWLLAPLGPMILFQLFSDAFLKFLLVAGPAWCLLVALAVSPGSSPKPGRLVRPWKWAADWGGPTLVVVGGLFWAALILPGYYQNAQSRDNYAGVARYVEAVEGGQKALVLLDAPGQQEVWRYYAQHFNLQTPVLALPQSRPLDPEQTLATLSQAVADRETVYALFWATEQADPQGVVESWLDGHAFKGLESWQGNVRLATYHLAAGLTCADNAPPIRFGEAIALQQICRTDGPEQAGAAFLVSLQWRALALLDRAYKVTLQLLDPRNQVIAQQDSEPGGGSRPTTGWVVGEVVQDNHGLFIPVGTPPLTYRLILALYDSQSGERLLVNGGDALELGTLQIERPISPFPLDLIPMQQRLNRELPGGVTLLGYDLYGRGWGHDPQHPVGVGEWVHVTLYWQGPVGDIPLAPDLTMTLSLGEQKLDAPLAGGLFATGQWQAGDVVRGEFDLLFDGSDRRMQIQVQGAQVNLGRVPE